MHESVIIAETNFTFASCEALLGMPPVTRTGHQQAAQTHAKYNAIVACWGLLVSFGMLRFCDLKANSMRFGLVHGGVLRVRFESAEPSFEQPFQ